MDNKLDILLIRGSKDEVECISFVFVYIMTSDVSLM